MSEVVPPREINTFSIGFKEKVMMSRLMLA